MSILKFKNITKNFDNTAALNNINFSIEEGKITAICGENGSGKSTLMNIISGIYPYGEYDGSFYFEDKECRFKTIRDSEKSGIIIIPQELALCPNLTIVENMFLGHELVKHGAVDWESELKLASNSLKRIGWDKVDTSTMVSQLGIGKQQLVAIGKALLKDAKLLILDEPTAPLNDIESENLLNLLLEFKKDGITSIIITHKLNEVEKVADDIVIIRDGTFIEKFSRDDKEFSINRIIKGMVGRELTNFYPDKNEHVIKNKVFEIKNYNAFDPIESSKQITFNASLNVKSGEIVGISGLTGAGRSEMCLSFIDPQDGQITNGDIYIDNEVFKPKTPKDAISKGLYYVTEDRNFAGLLKESKIKRNIAMSSLKFLSNKFGKIDKVKMVEQTASIKEEFGIKAPSVDSLVSTLSGGNAQKVLLSRAIMSKPKIIILDEPTKGVDIQAKVEIYEIIHKMALSGVAILLISSEQAEIIGLCDRSYVMCEGKITAELVGEQITGEALLKYSLGDLGNEN